MRIALVKIVLSFFLAALPAVTAECAGQRSLTIYYVPFEFETYEPVTPGNIISKAKYTINLTDEESISKILALTSGQTESHFDRNRVRLLLILNKDGGDERLMVDAKGTVADGRSERALNAPKFDKLKALMSELTKGKD